LIFQKEQNPNKMLLLSNKKITGLTKLKNLFMWPQFIVLWFVENPIVPLMQHETSVFGNLFSQS